MPHSMDNNQQAREATKFLHLKAIPQLAESLPTLLEQREKNGLASRDHAVQDTGTVTVGQRVNRERRGEEKRREEKRRGERGEGRE